MIRFLWCLLLSMYVLSSKAEVVPFNTAQEIAYSVMAQCSQTRVAKKLVLVTDGETKTSRAAGNNPTYYLFGSEDGKGFVLVSGDTQCKPVLGYSFNSPFSMQNLPSNFKWYLEGIKQIVYEKRSRNASGVTATTRTWNGQQELKEELYYETAQWSQDKAYAADCPLGKYAGSIPTALGIIMRYHNWPDIGIGTAPSYTTSTSKLHVEARSLLHAYNWGKMPLFPKETEDYSEISKLLADIGTILKADYGTNSTSTSSAYLPQVVYMNFQYKNGSQMMNQKDFERYRWIQMLQTELQQIGPVLMEGGGHAFVIHGYNNDKMFAVNWGWGGIMNGYFELSPESESDYFKDNTRALFGLRPVDSKISMNGLPQLYMSPLYDKIFKYDSTENKVYFMAKTSNNTDYSALVRLVVVDDGGRVVQVLNEKNIKFSTWVIYYNSIELNEPIKEVAPGYNLQLHYKDEKSGLWMPIEHSEKNQWQIPLSNEKSILATTSFYFDRLQRNITLNVDKKINVEFLDANGLIVVKAKIINDHEINVDLSNVKCGSYILRLSNEFETKDIVVKV